MSESPPHNAVRGRLVAGGVSLEIGHADEEAAGRSQRVQLTDRIVLTPAAARRLALSLEEALASGRFEGAIDTTEAAGSDRVTPRGRTPVHAQSSAAVEFSTRLMAGVGSLDVPYQHERSVRLAPGRLEGNRYLLTCNVRDLGAAGYDKVMGVVDALGFPAALRETVRKEIDAAACAHFGFEEQAERTICKLYLERALDLASVAKGPSEPVLLHRAWKWEPRDGAYVEARYVWHPNLDAQALEDRVAAVYARGGGTHGADFVHAALAAARAAVEARKLPYLAVTEGDTSRDSFDVNFYEAGLPIGALQEPLFALREKLDISPGRFQALYDQIKARPLGHIAGGMHRDGSEFVTIYYGLAGFPHFNAKLGSNRRAADRPL